MTGLGVGDVVTGGGIPTGTTIVNRRRHRLHDHALGQRDDERVRGPGLDERSRVQVRRLHRRDEHGRHILSPPFNQNTLPIIVPGPQVLSTSVPGGNAAAGNLITDGTTSTLERDVRPADAGEHLHARQVDQIMGPAGSISGPQYFPSTSSTGTIIPAATSSTSPRHDHARR